MKSMLARVLLAGAVLACLAAALWQVAHHRTGGPERAPRPGGPLAVSTETGPAMTSTASTPVTQPSGLGDPRNAPPVEKGETGGVDGLAHTSDGHPVAAVVDAHSYATPPSPPCSARCGQDGRFSMGLSPGMWSIHAEAPGLMSVPTIITVKAGTTQRVDLVLQVAGAVAGLVTGPEGAPVAGAEVSSYYTVPEGEKAGSAKAFADNSYITKTDEHGRYRLAVLPGTHYLKADHEGFAPAMGQVTVPPGAVAGCDLQLLRGLQITGRVTDKAGSPIEGVELSAEWNGMSEGTYGGSYSRAAKSGADGRYTIAGLREGNHLLTATAKGYVQNMKYQVAAGATDVDFQMVKGGRIEGRVVRKSDGSAVESPTVTCRLVSQMAWEQNSVKVGKGGTFVVEGVGTGKHVVTARAAGYAPGQSAEIDLAPEQEVTGVEVQLGAGGTLRATVLSARTRQPIEGATASILEKVGLMDVDSDMMAGVHSDGARSDAEGHLVREHLPPGQHRIRVSHEDHASVTKTLEIVEGQETQEEFDLADGGRIFGKVTGVGGQPRTGASVSCTSMSFSEAKVAQTDEQGKYELKGLAAGTYMIMMYEISITAEKASAPKMNMRTVEVKDGESVEVDISPTDGVRVHGAVRQGGRAKANLVMQLIATSGGGAFTSCQTDASGNYDVENLRPGQYSVVIGEVMMKFAVPDGQRDVQQDFDLPTGGVSGHVYDARTRAKIEGASVMAYRTGGAAAGGMQELLDRMASNASTDADGAYTLSGLSDGQYVLQVSKDGYAVETSQPMAISGDATVAGKDFMLTGGAEIDGIVTDSARHPVAGAKFSLRDRKSGTPVVGNTMWMMASDEKGQFKIPGVRAGEYMLGVHAGGYASAQRVVRVIAGQNATVEVALTGAGSIRVHAKDAAGAPVQAASLTLTDASGNPVESALGYEDILNVSRWKTGADGTLDRGGLAPGHYRGQVSDGTRTGTFEVDVTEGQATDADVTLK